MDPSFPNPRGSNQFYFGHVRNYPATDELPYRHNDFEGKNQPNALHITGQSRLPTPPFPTADNSFRHRFQLQRALPPLNNIRFSSVSDYPRGVSPLMASNRPPCISQLTNFESYARLPPPHAAIRHNKSTPYDTQNVIQNPQLLTKPPPFNFPSRPQLHGSLNTNQNIHRPSEGDLMKPRHFGPRSFESENNKSFRFNPPKKSQQIYDNNMGNNVAYPDSSNHCFSSKLKREFEQSQSTLHEENLSQKEQDKRWINEWTSMVEFRMGIEHSHANTDQDLSIPEAQNAIKLILLQLQTLKGCQESLTQHMHDVDQKIWAQQKSTALNLQSKIQSSLMQLDKRFIENTKWKLQRIAKKRKRLHAKKEEKMQEASANAERRAALHKKIDSWRDGILQEYMESIRKKALKKMADNVLSEVRKKILETTRTLEVLRTLSKLRELRKASAEHLGLYTPKDSDHIFEDTISRLIVMMSKQKDVYDGEQKTLQVMLDTEQEESLEKEKFFEKVRKEKRVERMITRLEEVLFGNTATMDVNDPLYTFNMYQTLSEHNIEALAQIRRDWDAFLVPPDTPASSCVPQHWVIPVEPSDDVWASALASYDTR